MNIMANEIATVNATTGEIEEIESRPVSQLVNTLNPKTFEERKAVFNAVNNAQSLDDMKAFAYSQKEHAEVIQKTRQRNWYSEELFTRFKITGCTGTLNGKNPLRDYDLNL